jgi:hypothetical protein
MTDRQIVDKVKDVLHGDDNNDVRPHLVMMYRHQS